MFLPVMSDMSRFGISGNKEGTGEDGPFVNNDLGVVWKATPPEPELERLITLIESSFFSSVPVKKLGKTDFRENGSDSLLSSSFSFGNLEERSRFGISGNNDGIGDTKLKEDLDLWNRDEVGNLEICCSPILLILFATYIGERWMPMTGPGGVTSTVSNDCPRNTFPCDRDSRTRSVEPSSSDSDTKLISSSTVLEKYGSGPSPIVLDCSCFLFLVFNLEVSLVPL